MALSRPVYECGRDRPPDLLLLVAHYETLLSVKRTELRTVLTKKASIKKKREAAERRCRTLAALAVALSPRPRSVWTLWRPPSWYDTTVPTLSDQDFKGNFRVTRSTFAYIVSSCSSLAREDTNMRACIPLHKRVAISLYRLATSAEERTVAHLFGVSRSSVNLIFREFCDVVVNVLEPQIVQFPSLNNVRDHVRQFEACTGFPQGLGAMDGCHIKVSPPKENAQDYYNYKGWYSIILLAVVDQNYKFLYTNVGSPGRNHDAAVYRASILPKVVGSDIFTVPSQVIDGMPIGAVLLCDQAFPLQRHLMKPFPHRSAKQPHSANVQLHSLQSKACRRKCLWATEG
ncbi:hypothetical protein HPB48_020784 [Haemaphysalis longicornis]|uniref:DDE Tnp4 domain-containing protein n=1 Tax=Haemaphysalis longicornis TaxID=44386 RepID=A0A9J6FZG4_HAELO|nr:hypothetical protein HPB48_020784 [Haemaphysalis longicornis]